MLLGKRRKAGAKPVLLLATNPARQCTGGKDGGNRCWEQSIPPTKANPHSSDPFSAAVLLATEVSQDSCKG